MSMSLAGQWAVGQATGSIKGNVTDRITAASLPGFDRFCTVLHVPSALEGGLSMHNCFIIQPLTCVGIAS